MRYWLDCRDRWLRAVAWSAGRSLRIAQAMGRVAVRFWNTYGGANLLLTAQALVVVVGGSLLLWWAVFEPIVPLRSAEILSADPADGIVDRAKTKQFVIKRRVCMTHGAWGRVHRMFVGSAGQGVEHNISEAPSIFLPPGCHDRARRMDVPDTLPPGDYAYRTRVEFCNRVRCEVAWVQDFQITIVGPWPSAEETRGDPLRDPM